jgi:hypothetical protein
LNRSNQIINTIIATVVAIVGTSLVSEFFQSPQTSLSTVARIAIAKCPGLPGGSGSGGPDYINIAIDVGLVALFGYFLYLTVKDMRRRRKQMRANGE